MHLFWINHFNFCFILMGVLQKTFFFVVLVFYGCTKVLSLSINKPPTTSTWIILNHVFLTTTGRC